MFVLMCVTINVKVWLRFKFNADFREFGFYFLSALKNIPPEVIFLQLLSRESLHGVPLIDLHVVAVVRLHPPPQVARDAGVAVPVEGEDDGELREIIYLCYLAKLTQCLAILLETSLSVWLGRVFLIPQRVGVKR